MSQIVANVLSLLLLTITRGNQDYKNVFLGNGLTFMIYSNAMISIWVMQVLFSSVIFLPFCQGHWCLHSKKTGPFTITPRLWSAPVSLFTVTDPHRTAVYHTTCFSRKSTTTCTLEDWISGTVYFDGYHTKRRNNISATNIQNSMNITYLLGISSNWHEPEGIFVQTSVSKTYYWNTVKMYSESRYSCLLQFKL